MLIINPKRINESIEIKPYWYNYYAGYSHTFTKEIISTSGLGNSALILDPWNGAGTTTLMASMSGIPSIGIDLNPVMKVIARAKQATARDATEAEKQISSLTVTSKGSLDPSDSLITWFDAKSVCALRAIEANILAGISYSETNEKVDRLDSHQCLMYTALFNSIRECLKPFIPSNPTWIKKPQQQAAKISLNSKSFKSLYLSFLHDMVTGAKLAEHTWDATLSKLLIGSSSSMPVADGSVDLVLTSPPYCTRIDYGVATLPELSLIAVDGEEEIDAIRRSLMGTTTVPKCSPDIPPGLGSKCYTFLTQVKSHHSKASDTYYLKNFLQYFESLHSSIKEIYRVTRPGSRFVCVVQDSFYKDVHCNLPAILQEMAELSGFSFLDAIEFASKQNMGNVNSKSRSYRGSASAVETVLILEKGTCNE